MKITVTQEDIERGLRDNTYCCPIALALRRHKFVPEKKVQVWPKEITIDAPNKIVKLPVSAVRFIKKFDSESWMRGLRSM